MTSDLDLFHEYGSWPQCSLDWRSRSQFKIRSVGPRSSIKDSAKNLASVAGPAAWISLPDYMFGIRHVLLTVFVLIWKLFFSRYTRYTQRIRGFVIMHYINLLLTLTLTARLSAYLATRISQKPLVQPSPNFLFACCLWPWLGLPLYMAVLWHIMYFRFSDNGHYGASWVLLTG